MNSDKKNLKWHPLSRQHAVKLTMCTSSPGVVYQCQVSDLPAGLQAMPGLNSAYISGYCTPIVSCESLTRVSELVAVREDRDVRKAYNYFLAVSGNDTYFAGPSKHFQEHHSLLGVPVKVETLFGHFPLNSRTDKEP